MYLDTNGSGCAAIKKAARKGLLIICADGLTRFYFLIIAGFIADYKEQVLIIDIKSRR